MSKQLSVLKCASLAIMMMATSVQAKTINKTFDVSQGGHLKLETSAGAIEVASHNKDLVIIEVNINGSDEERMKVHFEHSGDTVKVKGEMERGGFKFFSSKR